MATAKFHQVVTVIIVLLVSSIKSIYIYFSLSSTVFISKVYNSATLPPSQQQMYPYASFVSYALTC